MSAVYPVAAGITSHSGVLNPEVWAGKTLVKFYKATVFAAISNTDYEGEIKSAGDTVHIRTIPDITIRKYSIGQDLTYENPKATVVDLLIDQGYYYGVGINDVNRAQSDMNYVEDWTNDAGEQMGITIDEDILSDVYADAATANKGATAGAKSESINLGVSGTPLEIDKTNILDVLVDVGVAMDEQNLPNSGRSIVLPAIFCGLIKKSDLKDASLTGDATSVLRNGRIGNIDRLTIYMSNQIATTSDTVTVHNCIACHKSALTFASQLVENETLKNPKDFGDLLRGLQVYGYETIKTEGMFHLYAYKS